MAITTAATVPLSNILIRNYLGETLGWEAAGYWEAMWRLSAAYLMLVSTTLSVYYLPRLSELKSGNDIKKEIISCYYKILPLVIIISLFVYLTRNTIIRNLFSAEFMPMSELFLWQLIGDVLKIGSWLIAYVMLSKSMALAYILTEIFFSVSFVVLTVVMIDSYGLIGASFAYAINYLFYLIVVIMIVGEKIREI
jgi:PST family polysaccharide transporter